MKTFNYTIKDQLGIHARPAWLLVKIAKNFESIITITKDEKTVDISKLMMLMSLCVTKGAEVKIQAEGVDEEAAMEAVEKFFVENL